MRSSSRHRRSCRVPIGTGRERSDPGSRERGDRSAGQASVEHAAIVLVVLVVLSGGVAVAGGAPIVNAVHSGLRRAICVAGGDGCAAFHEQRPCLVARDDRRQSSGASFLVFRIGGSEGLVVERRSDGSVVVTAYRDAEGGVGLSIGVRFGLGRTTERDDGLVAADGGGRAAVEASAGVEARLRGGWGRSWELPDQAAAEGFLRRYVAERRAALPVRGEAWDGKGVGPPDVERVQLGADGTVTGEVSGPLGLEGTASAMVGLRGEGARDRRTGRTTVSVVVPGSIAGALAGPLGLELGGGLRVEPSLTLVLDREMRPRELRLLGRAATGAAREREVQLRLDLTRPELGRDLRALLGGLGDGDAATAVGAALRLGRWAATEGWVDEREYRTETHGSGREGELALGLRLGFHEREQRSRSTLVAARSRPPGGIWESRDDCLAAA